jgi:hypothetical protein
VRRPAALAAGLALAIWLAGLALGQPALAGAQAPARAAQAGLQPWPITITIRTVPALAGVRFSFDGTTLVTGSRGMAAVTERHNFSLHTLRLLTTRVGKPGRRYTFARWAGQRDPNQAFVPMVHGLPMRADYTVTAGFSARCPVTPNFTDQHGAALDPGRITQVSVRSDAGRAVRLSPSGTTWLPCVTAAYVDSAMRKKEVQYSVQSVMISGANIVHAGVERFWPGRTARPRVVGYFHDLTIASHDALFGAGTGTVALLTQPNHLVRRVPLGTGHSVTLSNLPQGEYRVDVKAGSAIISAQSLRLSRDQSVNLTAVSRADLATIGGVALFIVLGLPLLSGSRRKRLLGLLRRQHKEAASA